MPFQSICRITLCFLLPLPSVFLLAGSGSVLSGRPFIIIWNAPTSPCLSKFGVQLDVENFNITINQNHTFLGNKVVIFYSTHLGYYPYYDQVGFPVNGGLPQNASVEKHLMKVMKDVKAVMFPEDFNGVAVVDWENWRPLWNRNWNGMVQYRLRSMKRVYRKHPTWSYIKLTRLAKTEFENAAQSFMRRTLEMGRKLRPRGLWGFYGYPYCYNYGFSNHMSEYTGECLEAEVRRNDLLAWLWKASSALYPDIYLDRVLKMSEKVGKFVKHRVEEGLRISKQVHERELPVLPYARIVYKYSMDFLTQEDLVQTIGQSAALGAAGVILWGNGDYSASKESCLAVKSYLHDVLGKYTKNVTSASFLCSQNQCSGKGRCVRNDSSSQTYLHLDPEIFTITGEPQDNGFRLEGASPNGNATQTWPHFRCQCYRGWEGEQCTKKQRRRRLFSKIDSPQ
uniref:Hyaluronidase n=1 Tax=Leptobrachium leishanense TaxID=445787 RepID=A0A8C5PHA7_9ANUR